MAEPRSFVVWFWKRDGGMVDYHLTASSERLAVSEAADKFETRFSYRPKDPMEVSSVPLAHPKDFPYTVSCRASARREDRTMSLTIGSTIKIRGTVYAVRCIGPTGEGKFFGKRAFLLEDVHGNFVQGYGKTLAANSKLTEVSSDVSRAMWAQRGYVFPAAEPETAEETADDGAPTSSYGCGDESCEGCYGTEAWRLANLPAYWLAEQFRYEMCEECGQDEDGHTAERDAFGNFRAICLPSDVEVRELAAGWAAGCDELQSLATTGAILPGLSDLISRNLDPKTSHDGNFPAEGSSEAEELRSIARYAEVKGERGPVSGWSDLNY